MAELSPLIESIVMKSCENQDLEYMMSGPDPVWPANSETAQGVFICCKFRTDMATRRVTVHSGLSARRTRISDMVVEVYRRKFYRIK